MNNLKNIFLEKNLEKIPSEYWDENNSVCWYPSCEYDFRHIFFWNYHCKKINAEFPKIIIHNDFNCLNNNPYPYEYLPYILKIMAESIGERTIVDFYLNSNPLLHSYYILDLFNTNILVTLNSTELFLKEDVFYPNSELYQFCDMVGKFTHRIVAIECRLFYFTDKELKKTGFRGGIDYISPFLSTLKEIEKNIPVREEDKKFLLLFFSMENSNFFYDVILRNNLSIDYLTHINDGGRSFGGSLEKMNFIYLYSSTIGLKKMLIDMSLKIKKQDITDWSHKTYINAKIENIIKRKKPEINYEEWQESNIGLPESKGIFIAGNRKTGNFTWNDDMFEHGNYYLYEKKS